MTAIQAQRFGFDITVVPDGIDQIEGEKKARISVVFRPNGKINGIRPAEGLQSDLIEKHLAELNIVLPADQQDAIFQLLRENPNALITSDSLLTEGESEVLTGVDMVTRYAILAGRENPIRNELVAKLASWLRRLPSHLWIAEISRKFYVRESGQAQGDPQARPLCYVEIQQNPSEVIPIPCDLVKEEYKVPEGQTITADRLVGVLDQDDGLDISDILEADVGFERLRGKPLGTRWEKDEAQAVWDELFDPSELEDLARAILFPADPGGESSLEQILVRNPSNATVRDDGASQLAEAMAEIKTRELFAGLKSARAEGEARSFAKGLSAGDMVGTVFARLLGTVRPFGVQPWDLERFDEALRLGVAGDDSEDLTIARARLAATVRSLLVENGDGITGSYRIGNLRPGFAPMMLEVELQRMEREKVLHEKSASEWAAAFDDRKPDEGFQSLAPLVDSETANAVAGVAEAFAASPDLSLSQDAAALAKEGDGADPNLRAFAETLAINSLAWRKANGTVELPDADQRAQKAMKRFMELYAHPVLAAAFGLVCDFHIDLDELPGTDGVGDFAFFSIGAISAVYLPHNRSAAVIEKSRIGPLAFRPAGRDEWFNGTKDEKDGISDLTEVDATGKPRFVLQTLDEQQALRSLTLAAQSTANQYAEGEPPAKLDVTLPQFRTYGIALMDRWRFAEETDRKAALGSAKRTVFKPLLLFAETLTIGHRIDIGIVQGNRTIWFDAGDRDISYFADGSGAPIPGDLSTKSGTRPELRERTASYVTPINRYLDHPDAKQSDGKTSAVVGGRADIVAQQTLVTWFGRTLSLPRRALEDEFEERNWFAPLIDPAESPLPIRMDYHEPVSTEVAPESGPSTGVSLLAEGLEYFLARRPVFLNRGGPRLSDCWRHYDGLDGKAALRLGRSGAQQALEFGRNEPIAAPEVLLTDNANQKSPAKEPLFYSHNVEVPDLNGLRHGDQSSYITWWPGNSTDTLILRAEGAAGSLTSPDGIEIIERYILPPRVDITTAEVSGLLYGLKDTNTPRGMFEGSGVRQVPWGGGFPLAVGGEEIEDPPEPQAKESDPMAMPAASDENDVQQVEVPSKPARGGLINNDPDQNSTRYPWYPDPLASILCVMPVRHGLPLLDKPLRVSVLTQPWPRLSTALLQFLRRGQQPEPQTIFRDEAFEGNGFVLRLGETVRPFIGQPLPTIGIWLDDGRNCDLAVWYAPEDDGSLGSHGLVQSAFRSPGRLTAMGEVAAASTQSWGTNLRSLALTSPLPGLVNYRLLSLFNAVQKPLTPPSFVPPDAKPPVPFVRLNIAEKIAKKLDADAGLDPKQAAIQAINEWLGGKNIVEKLATSDGSPHDEGATTILLGGKVDMDRPTSSELRVEARWEDWADDISRPARRAEPKTPDDTADPDFLRPFRPVAKGEWIVLEGMRGPVSNLTDLQGTPVDLLRDENGVPRCLIHDFLDTKARRLELRIAAVSRHAGLFAAEGEPDEFVTHGPAYTFDLPATSRPAEPVLAADMLPVFSEEKIGLISSGEAGPRLNGVRIERNTRLRFFLKRPWFDAGEGQKLAVLLWDGALFDPDVKSPVDDYETTPAAIPPSVRPYVSLHGRDPKFASGSLPDFMTGADILNDLNDQRLAHLQLPGVEPMSDDFRVSAALFPVMLDRTTDVWLADIALAARERYMSFVRLSLAACQTNAIPGLELSRPIEAWGRVPPPRAASLSVRRPNGKAIANRLRVTVDGSSYTKRDVGPTLREYAAMADAPWLEIFFLQRFPGVLGPGGWTLADFPQPAPVQAGAPESGTTERLWDLDIALPPGWNDDAGAANRAVLIREYERIASDAEGPEPALAEPEHSALQIVEAFATSEDGLSSIIRGKTTFATLVMLEEVFMS